jgi:hypothetical protein
MAGRGEIRQVIRTSLREHPQRTLTKIGWVGVSHSSILQKDQTERNPGRFTCGVTRPVGFHNGITEPTANGKATGVGADAETLSGLGVSARKNSDAPRVARFWSAAPKVRRRVRAANTEGRRGDGAKRSLGEVRERNGMWPGLSSRAKHR